MRRIYKAIKPMFETHRWRVFPGDVVYINHGPHKGQSGRVLQVLKDTRVPQVIVEGINLRKKKIENPTDPDKVLVVTMEAPLHYSQVSLMEPEMSEAETRSVTRLPSQRWVRAKFRYLADGTRVRVGAGPNATGVIIPIPPTPGGAAANKLGEGYVKDTKAAEVMFDTYQPQTPSAGFDTWFSSVMGKRQRLRRHHASRQPDVPVPSAGTAQPATGTLQYSTCTNQQLQREKWQYPPPLLSAGLCQQHTVLPLHLYGRHLQCRRLMHTHCMGSMSVSGSTPITHIASSSLAMQALLLQQQAVVPVAG